MGWLMYRKLKVINEHEKMPDLCQELISRPHGLHIKFILITIPIDNYSQLYKSFK